MNAIDLALRQLDDLWSHSWESFSSVLTELGEDEASWRATCYRDISNADLAAPSGSVLWHLAQLAACKSDYADRLSEGTDIVPPSTANGSLNSVLDQLRREHERERDAIARLRPDDLARVLPDGLTVAGLLALALRHDAWHLGQIAVARRLFREHRRRRT